MHPSAEGDIIVLVKSMQQLRTPYFRHQWIA